MATVQDDYKSTKTNIAKAETFDTYVTRHNTVTKPVSFDDLLNLDPVSSLSSLTVFPSEVNAKFAETLGYLYSNDDIGPALTDVVGTKNASMDVLYNYLFYIMNNQYEKVGTSVNDLAEKYREDQNDLKNQVEAAAGDAKVYLQKYVDDRVKYIKDIFNELISGDNENSYDYDTIAELETKYISEDGNITSVFGSIDAPDSNIGRKLNASKELLGLLNDLSFDFVNKDTFAEAIEELVNLQNTRIGDGFADVAWSNRTDDDLTVKSVVDNMLKAVDGIEKKLVRMHNDIYEVNQVSAMSALEDDDHAMWTTKMH